MSKEPGKKREADAPKLKERSIRAATSQFRRRAAVEKLEMTLKRIHLRQLYRIAIVFSIFQKSLVPEETVGEALQLEDEESDFSRIRCPLCAWQPDASSRWYCADCAYPEGFVGGCGMGWNTFATRGLCPGCGHQWRWTGCLHCYVWSLHEEWYTQEKPD